MKDNKNSRSSVTQILRTKIRFSWILQICLYLNFVFYFYTKYLRHLSFVIFFSINSYGQGSIWFIIFVIPEW